MLMNFDAEKLTEKLKVAMDRLDVRLKKMKDDVDFRIKSKAIGKSEYQTPLRFFFGGKRSVEWWDQKLRKKYRKLSYPTTTEYGEQYDRLWKAQSVMIGVWNQINGVHPGMISVAITPVEASVTDNSYLENWEAVEGAVAVLWAKGLVDESHFRG